MILLADSGSTKTHWACLAKDGVRELLTDGLNPRLTDDNAFATILTSVREQMPLNERVEMLHFYGAGCGTRDSQAHVAQLLREAFGNDVGEVRVEGDLLGACRASCGTSAGWVGILGTGSNLCFYDGQSIARQRVSTGYILGDEGSGNHIGRRLLKDYLEERMPNEISVMFHDTYKLTTDQFIDRLYRQPNPNRFLASLASFAADHQSERYIAAVLEDCFDSFFCQLESLGGAKGRPLHLVGGITQSFAQPLTHAAARRGITLGKMLGLPMPGLIAFHSKAG